jgi:hypothetical protein
VSGLARSALAGPKSLTLDWAAPAECPDGAAIERAVNDVVAPNARGTAARSVRGVVTRPSPTTYHVDLAIETEPGRWSERSLSGATCASVSDAAALVIALAEHAERDAPLREPPRAREAGADARSTRERPFIVLSAALDHGATAGLAPGVSVLGGASFAQVRWEASVSYFAPQTASVAGAPELGAKFTLWNVSARACYPLWRGALWLSPCAGAGMDGTRGVGFGAHTPLTATSWVLVARAGALTEWELARSTALRLDLEAILPFARPEFTVDGAGAVFRRDPLGFRGAFGVELRF